MSVSPHQHTMQHVKLRTPTLEWGPCEMWYTPKTWLACFLLATTVPGGEDLTATGYNCKEEAGL